MKSVKKPKQGKQNKFLDPNDHVRSNQEADQSAHGTDHSRPHYYGAEDGVHVFHATDESHKSRIGIHVESPSESEFKDALKDAKSKGIAMVMIHGAAPKRYRSEIHPDLGPVVSSKLKKTEVSPVRFGDDSLKKASFVEPEAGADMKNVGGKLKALQSKLRQRINPSSGDSDQEQEEFHDKFAREFLESLTAHLKEIGSSEEEEHAWLKNAFSDQEKGKGQHTAFDESDEDEAQEAKEFKEANSDQREKMAFEEMNELEEQLKDIHRDVNAKAKTSDSDDPITVPTPEMAVGSDEKETLACPDCGSNKSFCDCYQGLAEPRVEIDLRTKKIQVFFKSEWSPEDREAYLGDVKNRIFQLALRRIAKR